MQNTSYTHLIQGDLAPFGRMHLVQLGPDVGDEHERHMLTEMDADANMGAKNLVKASRRGPFKRSGGRSRVMDRSAHVVYRRRGRALEITISRGITSYEMETLIGKLNVHRLGTHGCLVFLIKGNSRKKLGNIDDIALEKLRDKIHKMLTKSRVIGLLLQDSRERGILHKAHSHGMQQKDAYRSLLKSATFGID